MKPALFTSLFCLAIVAGCAVGPNYHPPKTAAPAQWSSPLAGGETNAPAALAGWWKNFGDTNLDSLMTLAVRSNLDLRIAEAHVREARAERDVATGSWWPSVDGTAGYSRNRWGANSFPPIPPGTPLDYNLYNAGFDAAWELDLFGGTRRAVEAANAEIGAAEYGQRDVLVSLLAEVARNYITARGYQQRVAITRENISVQKDILNLTRSRYQNGLGSDLDVQQATALLAATESQVPSLETGFQQSVHHLAVLLGRPHQVRGPVMHGDHRGGADRCARRGLRDRLVEQRQPVAHRAVRRAGDQGQRLRRDRYPLLDRDGGEMGGQLGHRDEVATAEPPLG